MEGINVRDKNLTMLGSLKDFTDTLNIHPSQTYSEIFSLQTKLTQSIKDKNEFKTFIAYIVEDLQGSIVQHYQQGMCWNLSDEQDEIVHKRYLMSYSDNQKDLDLNDVCNRMQRTITSQLTIYMNDTDENIILLRKFEYLLHYMLEKRLFILNTPQMFNLGNGLPKYKFTTKTEDMNYEQYLDIYTNINRHDFTTAQCFILDMEDTIESIFDTLKKQAMIQKQAGGIGFNIGRLRPKDQYIRTSDSSSSGCLSFLQVYNETGKVIKQGNKRRWQGMQIISDMFDKFWELPCSFHPDTLAFINQKKNNTGDSVLQNFNISVGITNSLDLYNKYMSDGTIQYTFQGNKWSDSIHPSLKDKCKDTVLQKDILTTLQDNAHKTGDPGLLFLDKINNFNPLRNEGLYMVQCNPCGERPGVSSQKYNMYDTCDLGHIDLSKLLIKNTNGLFVLDASILYNLQFISQYVLDLLHDLLMYPIDDVKKGVLQLRSVGLGFYGLQGSLMLMGVPYDSCDQRSIQNYIMKIKEVSQSNMSFTLQKYQFPYLLQDKMEDQTIPTQGIWSDDFQNNLDNIKNQVFGVVDYETGIQRYFQYSEGSNFMINSFIEFNNGVYPLIKNLYKTKKPRRNINLTTIQPTGTTSIIGQTQILGDTGSGIEPLYSLKYRRFINNLDGTRTEQLYNSKLLLRLIDKQYLIFIKSTTDFFNYLPKELSSNDQQFNAQIDSLVSIQKEDVNKVFDESNVIFHALKKWVEKHFTQMEINFIDHIKMQEAIQISCSSQISKTINMKNDQKVKDVLDTYLYALKSKYIKGITIYRDGSLQNQVLETTSQDQTKEQKKKSDIQEKLSFLKFNIDVDAKTGRIKPKVKPVIMESLKKSIGIKVDNKEKKFHIEVGFTDNNEPFEVFVRTTESSQEYTNMFNLYGRLISTQFRSGLDIQETLTQQKKVKSWKNEYDPVIQFITSQVEEVISIAKKSSKQKKQMIEGINEQFVKQSFEPGCSTCGEQ